MRTQITKVLKKKKKNCSKTDLSSDKSQENLETENRTTISTQKIITNVSDDNNNNLQSTNVQPEKI